MERFRSVFIFSLAFIVFLSACSVGKRSIHPEVQLYSSKTLFPESGREDLRTPESFSAASSGGMVVTEGRAPTEIGLSVLRRGGNAIDAAVAVSFALAVYRPHSTGIGGGGFVLFHSVEEDAPIFLDMRERAPERAARDMFVSAQPDSSRLGGLSVGVPGLVAGLFELHEKYGSGAISWKELVEPSVILARDGFSVYPHLANAINWFSDKGYLKRFPKTAKLLTQDTGDLLGLGDVYRNPALADTLQQIADEGPSGFYSGPVAEDIIKTVWEHGGIVSRDDLDSYRVVYRAPVRTTYRNYEIVSAPPPSSGGSNLIQMLNMIENFDTSSLAFSSSSLIHLKAEVMRRAFSDRAKYFGDPDYFSVPLSRLLSKDYAKEKLEELSLTRASKSLVSVSTSAEEMSYPLSTTHLSIRDKQGNVVSSTQSINYFFGSGVVTENSGIFLNNTMDDFTTRPGEPNTFGLVQGEGNTVEPGKTPLSSMTPTVVFSDGAPVIALGSPGGPKIISAVFNVLVNYIDHHMRLTDAVFAPRVHHQWLPDTLVLDSGGFPSSLIVELDQMGHVVEETDYGVGSISALAVTKEGRVIGVGDPRREGFPAGY